MKKDQLIKQAALTLFSQFGWMKVSIDMICRQAKVSRVTFYKYFANKKALLKYLLEEQKNDIRRMFTELQENEASLEVIIDRIFTMQQQSLAGLYSESMLFDLTHNKDEELEQFFAAMAQEKYRFMHRFFCKLQQKKIIQPQLPIILMDIFIRKIDEIVLEPALLKHYENNEQQMFKDVLRLLMYGISYKP
ncbi:TetR/AcrR family transcriptional regulator [Bisgaard Taxon 10/6]|uniref:TetR/AcrR family transcriptional regulator n=1 Tax=Exercitatus varius TaxID=67857 RepID=A0ABT6ETX2_9PAST|nr:TetR/AcrR family transcriptional regulator [Exercitatus varius]MDG2939787.1 TetR/AcrR family transcriptional regulator [Exercitatus varius]MDG2946471.1 TetR/AcrR family transcriptional regulator [Exercitatus varius]